MKQQFDKNTAEYVYILVRRDLPPAYQCVQACHAAMKSVHHFQKLHQETRLSVLHVEDEEDLQRWMLKLEEQDIEFQPFFEPDHSTGYSALATQMLSSEKGRIFKRLKLMHL